MAVSCEFSSVVELLSKFQTHNIDAAWLSAAWEDHSQLEFLPADYEELHQDTEWKNILDATCEEVRRLVLVESQNGVAGKAQAPVPKAVSEGGRTEELSEHENEEVASSFWVTLVENGISIKGVVIVTAWLIERGSGRTSIFPHCQIALYAACLYLGLICIPGSNAFRLFNPLLYQKSIDLLTMAKRFSSENITKCSASGSIGKRKRNYAKRTAQRKSRAAGGKNAGEGEQEEGPESEEDDSIQDRSDTEDSSFSVQRMKSLLDSMRQLLRDLNLLLKSFTLKHYAQSLEHTIQRLTELLDYEGKSHAVDLGSLSKDIRDCLMVLCTQFHGPIKATVTLVMKRMFHMLLSNATHAIINCVCHLVTDIPDGMALPGARILIQNMCVKAPERADARHKTSSMILVLIDQLTPPAFFGIVDWLLRFMQSPKVNSRIFAMEIVALILGRKPGDRSLSHLLPGDVQNLSGKCLGAVLDRCSDIASTVRSKALAILANCVTTENSLAYSAVLMIFAPERLLQIRRSASSLPVISELPNDSVQQSTLSCQKTGSEVSSPSCNQEKNPRLNGALQGFVVTPTSVMPTLSEPSKSSQESPSGTDDSALQVIHFSSELPTIHLVMELLRDRAADKKVHVRKAAIQVLQRVMELNAECLSPENIQTLQERCRDTSILVKKQSMQALTAILLSYPMQQNLQQAWMHGVLPSIVDPENSIQEKCVEMIDDVLLKNVVGYSQSVSLTHTMAWVIMNEIAHNESHFIKAWRFIQRACLYMARSGKLKKNLVQVLQSHINTANDDATWLLLSALAQCTDIKKSDFVYSYWDTHQHEIDRRSVTLMNVLKVMSAICKHSDETTVAKYFSSLSALLEELACSYKIITTLVETIAKLSEVNKSKKATTMLHNVCGNVFKKCDRYLASVFLTEASNLKAIDEESAIRHLTAIAEVAMIQPKLKSERICIILKSIIASKCRSPQAVENVDILGSQETQSTQRLVKFGIGALSQRIQNFALISLGKLCLQNETLAKDCTPALARVLETATDPVARNNIVVILVDLCVRYTTMVDPYFPSVTACLKDQSFIVRNQTLTLLTHLLQEDYIKWRGSLFFCFVTALVDPSPAIRTFTEHAILHILTKRHPAMLFQHFVECLFFFNAYQGHQTYNNITQSEKEAKLFSLPGNKNAEKRMTLYKFMLANMADEHRFQVTAKLCQDILGGIVGNMIKLKLANGTMCANGQNLVRDTLGILSSDEIKLATLRNTPQDEFEDVDAAAAALATAKKTVVSQVVKKNVIENIVPILISLKHKLENLHSPLLKDLMLYLKELVKGDFKAEVKEVLGADRQLSAEIEYDLKKFEQEQTAEQLLQTCYASLGNISIAARSNGFAPQAVEAQNDVPVPLQNINTGRKDPGPALPSQNTSAIGDMVKKPAGTRKSTFRTGDELASGKLDISFLPVVQLERLDCSNLQSCKVSVANDSKATLYDERLADTVINSPPPPRISRRRNTSRSRTANKSQEQHSAAASASDVPNLTLKHTDLPLPPVIPKSEPISPGRVPVVDVPNTPAKSVVETSLLRVISTPFSNVISRITHMTTGNLSPIAKPQHGDYLLHLITPEMASTQSRQWDVVPSVKRPTLAPLIENEEVDSS